MQLSLSSLSLLLLSSITGIQAYASADNVQDFILYFLEEDSSAARSEAIEVFESLITKYSTVTDNAKLQSLLSEGLVSHLSTLTSVYPVLTKYFDSEGSFIGYSGLAAAVGTGTNVVNTAAITASQDNVGQFLLDFVEQDDSGARSEAIDIFESLATKYGSISDNAELQTLLSAELVSHLSSLTSIYPVLTNYFGSDGSFIGYSALNNLYANSTSVESGASSTATTIETQATSSEASTTIEVYTSNGADHFAAGNYFALGSFAVLVGSFLF